MTDRACDHDTDRIAEELRQLIEAAARRAEEYLGRDRDSGTCERCPVCLVLAALRGERSEWAEGLSARVAALLASLREAVSADGRTGAPPEEAPEDSSGHRATKVRRIGVQRVSGTVLDREDPSVGAPASAGRAEDPGC